MVGTAGRTTNVLVYKMKNIEVLWMVVGLSVSITSSLVPAQISSIENVLPLNSSTPRSNDAVPSTVSVTELGDRTIVAESIDDYSKYGEAFNFVIDDNMSPEEISNKREQTIDSPLTMSINDLISTDEEFVPVREEDFYYNDVINRDPSEIMDTAAGFVPIPIFRKKHKSPKPHKASRRRYKKPYSYRNYYFYPYYKYYPTSLSFYPRYIF